LRNPRRNRWRNSRLSPSCAIDRRSQLSSERRLLATPGRGKIEGLEALEQVSREPAARVCVHQIVLDHAQSLGQLIIDDALLVEALGFVWGERPQEISNELVVVKRFSR
jgi:hypothetical protein